MTRINFKELIIIVLAGLLCGVLWVSFFGYNVTVSPIKYFSHFGSAAFSGKLRLLWNALIFYGVLSGLCLFTLLLYVFRYSVRPSLLAALVFAAAVLLGAHFLVPLYYSIAPFSRIVLRVWGLGFEISVLISSVLAYVVASRQKHNYAIKGTSA